MRECVQKVPKQMEIRSLNYRLFSGMYSAWKFPPPLLNLFRAGIFNKGEIERESGSNAINTFT